MRIQKDTEERRQELLQTAKRLFIAKGYHATTIKDIVTELNIAHGLFYYYFNSKEHIFEALAEKSANTVVANIRSMIQSPMAPQEKIFNMFGPFIQIAKDEKSLFNLIPTVDSDLFHAKVYSCAVEQLIPLVAKIVEEGNASGDFHCTSPMESTQILLRGIFALLQTVPHEQKIPFLVEHIPVLKGVICNVYGIDQGVE